MNCSTLPELNLSFSLTHRQLTTRGTAPVTSLNKSIIQIEKINRIKLDLVFCEHIKRWDRTMNGAKSVVCLSKPTHYSCYVTTIDFFIRKWM